MLGVAPVAAQESEAQEIERLWRQFDVPSHAPVQTKAQPASATDFETGKSQSELGYVFIDGQYLSPPYTVEAAAGSLQINSQAVRSQRSAPERSQRRGGRHRESDEGSYRYLGEMLDQDSIVVSLPGQPLVFISDPGARYDLFSRLMKRNQRAVTDVAFTYQVPAGMDQKAWHEWIARFTPTPGFQARANEVLREYEAAEAKARSEIAAAKRLSSMAYPLTVCGMVATTLAFGHLLANRPPKLKTRLETDTSPETLHAVSWSLVLIIGLSVLDLVWTILTSQANQMRELNPLGSQWIEDPTKLVIFKTAAIGMAVSLLYGLRQYRQAQLGAWWAVLICTLLTVRWLTFNSMHVA